MIEKISTAFQRFWDSTLEHAPEIIIAFGVLVLMIFLGSIIRNFTKARLKKRIQDQLLVNFIGRMIFLTFLIIGFVIFLNQIGLGGAAGGLLAGAGVSALVIGFAFKDIGENFIAGFFLAFSRPFAVGDIIQLDSFTGTVKSLNFRNTHIRTFDGRDVFMPNSMLIKNPLTNFTRDGLMRHDFVIGLDYGDDISSAIQSIIAELTSTQNIVQEEDLAPFVTIKDFGTSTINLQIFFWINTYDFLGSTTVLKSKVMHHVMKKLANEGFNMPADIIELKIYQEGQPIPVTIKDFKK